MYSECNKNPSTYIIIKQSINTPQLIMRKPVDEKNVQLALQSRQLNPE
jgi:hypothetical protein